MKGKKDNKTRGGTTTRTRNGKLKGKGQDKGTYKGAKTRRYTSQRNTIRDKR